MTEGLAELREVIEGLDLPVEPAVLAEAFRLLDQLRGTLARQLGEAEDVLVEEGALSVAGWLREHAGMTNRDAAAFARLARRCRQLPEVAGAWTSGALSGAQVEVITTNVTDRTVAGFAATAADVVPSLVGLPLAETTVAVQRWRARVEAELEDDEVPDEPPRQFHHSRTLDGRYESTGSWDADGGAVIDAAVKLAMTHDGLTETRTAAERRADAVVEIHQFFLDHQRAVRGVTRRPHVNLVVTVEDDDRVAGGILDGPVLPGWDVAAHLCDCTAHRVLVDAAGAILDYGRATRTVPIDLRNAVVLRDRHCREPGCDRGPEWCDVHHVVAWEVGGDTALDNLVLKCRRHHHRGHRPGWQDKLLPDATYVVTDPRGRTTESRPFGALTLPRAVAA